MQWDSELGLAYGLELEERLAEQPPGGLACGELDLDGRQGHQYVEEVDAAREPLERGRAHRSSLIPAPEQEQRVGGVAAEHVAVDRVKPGVLRCGDACLGDVDRLHPAAHRD